MSLWKIAFFVACFGGGCISAAHRAKRAGMLRMVMVWKILSIASFIGCGVAIIMALAK